MPTAAQVGDRADTERQPRGGRERAVSGHGECEGPLGPPGELSRRHCLDPRSQRGGERAASAQRGLPARSPAVAGAMDVLTRSVLLLLTKNTQIHFQLGCFALGLKLPVPSSI